jgi:hypothetical protein
VQLCGDAHLSNFGMFASPERRLLFDLNDFDETLPGPFEWDVKRMAASFTIAARHNGFAKMDTRAVTQASVRAYREAMASFADMGTLAIWYAHLSEDELVHAIRSAAAEASKPKKAAKGAEKSVLKVTGKARTRDSLQALSKLGEIVDGRYRIVSQPPIVVPVRDLEATYGLSSAQAERNVHAQFRAYRAGLREDQRQLRDMKGSAEVETMVPAGLGFYAGICGWTLARAHARSGDPIAHRRLPGPQRPVRPVDYRLLPAVRRPERTGL